METHDFGWALDQLRDGKAVAREGWNGPKHLRLQVPDAGSKNTLPYIWIRTVQGDRVQGDRVQGDRVHWLTSQTDILATDWDFVEAPTPV